MTYERLLRRQGYRVVTAGSCGRGSLAVESAAVRLVIADLRLPDGDGLDVVRAARALPAPPPVLVATAPRLADRAGTLALAPGRHGRSWPKPFAASGDSCGSSAMSRALTAH